MLHVIVDAVITHLKISTTPNFRTFSLVTSVNVTASPSISFTSHGGGTMTVWGVQNFSCVSRA